MPTAEDPRLVLIRHGQTAWSVAGKHTGLTDVPLTEQGEHDARALAAPLRAFRFTTVVSSDLQRATRTAELAGLAATPDTRLREWDYGAFEGRTTDEIRAERGPTWTIFDGVEPGVTPGESLAQVAARAAAVLDELRPLLKGESVGRPDGDGGPNSPSGDVAVVAHSHVLRVIAALWLGLPPDFASRLLLDPASISVLRWYREQGSLERWNDGGHLA